MQALSNQEAPNYTVKIFSGHVQARGGLLYACENGKGGLRLVVRCHAQFSKPVCCGHPENSSRDHEPIHK